MRRTIAAIALMLAAALPVMSGPYRTGKLVIVVAHGAMLEDITSGDLPAFQHLFGVGAGAVMTTRAAGDPGKPEKSDTASEAACVTIGSGSRAIGGMETRAAYNSDEWVEGSAAAALYRRLSMRQAPAGSIVMITANEIESNNAHLPYSIRIGLLGDTLRKAGLVTACVGNSDTFFLPHREAASICMDSDGVIGTGDVGRGLIRRSPYAPYGVETSTKALLAAFDRAISRANLVVVDVGDFARADWYGDNCTDAQAQKMRRWAARRLDTVLGGIMRRLDLRSSRIVFLSPGASHWKPYANRKLAPVLIAGEGVTHGLLTSGSTRRPGLITNTDLAPDIMEYFRVPIPPAAVGRPLRSTERSDPESFLLKFDNSLTLQNDRIVLMRLMAFILTAVVLLGTLLRSRSAAASVLALLPPLVAPLMLLLPAAGSYDPVTSGEILAGMAVAALLLIRLLRVKPIYALIWVSALLCVAVGIDLLRGGVWLAESPLSYSAGEAARFYGLGNEMLGSLIGAATLVIFGAVWPASLAIPFVRRLRTVLCVACFGAAAVLIGAPNLGADSGGALAALVAAAATLAVLSSGRMTVRRWLVVGVVPIAVFALFIVLDRLHGARGESHLTKALEMLSGGRAAEFGLIIGRKVGMNLKLLQSSMWSKLLLVCAGAVIYLRATAAGVERPEWSRHAVKVIAVGAFAAFVFNDSGVVAAATCLIYAWSTEMLAQARGKE